MRSTYRLKFESEKLRRQILALPTRASGRKIYPQSLKSEIIYVARKHLNLAVASRKIGISYITISKWTKKEIKNVPKPRRLLIEEKHSAEQYLEYQTSAEQSHEADSDADSESNFELNEDEQLEIPTQSYLIEVVLTNGITLRHIPFNSDSLSLLGGLV